LWGDKVESAKAEALLPHSRRLDGEGLGEGLSGLGARLGERGVFQGFGDLADDGFAREGFLKKEGFLEQIVAGGGLLEVAGHVDDFQMRVESLEKLGEGGAAHFGHDDVREDNVDGVSETFGNFEGFFAVFGGEDAIAGGSEEFASEFAYFALVFDNENSFASGDGRVEFRNVGCDIELLEGLREIHGEASAAAGSGIDVDEAATLLDDAVDGGQAKARALAGFLGGEEGLEDAGLGGGVHAVTSVGNGEQNVVTKLDRGMKMRVVVIDEEVLRFEGEPAAKGHGVAGVDGEVQENLFELAGVGFDAAERITEAQAEFDVFANETAEKLAHVGDEFVEVEDFGLKDLHAAEGEHLAGEGSGTVGSFANLLGAAVEGIFWLQMVEKQVAVAADDGEEIVEVVGDAAGHAAEGFHFLGLAELAFELFALGLVALEGVAHAVEGAR